MDPRDGSGPESVGDPGRQAHLGAEQLGDEIARRTAGRLTRWLSEATVEEAARTRSRRAWLRRIRDEDRTLVGLLLGAACTGERLSVGTLTGDRHHGVVLAVGSDMAALEIGGPATLLIALDAITELAGGVTAASTGRAARSMAEALRLLDPGVDLSVTTRAGGGARSGRLVGVGADVLTLDRDAHGFLHVPLAAIAAVRIDEPVD